MTAPWPRHDYLTVLTDGERVLEVAESRTQKATEPVLKTGLSAVQREGVKAVVKAVVKGVVKAVTMDMGPPFESAGAAVLPQAEIVYDRFHRVRPVPPGP